MLQAATVARIAFCAALLSNRAEKPLQKLAVLHEQRLAEEAAQVHPSSSMCQDVTCCVCLWP